MHPSFQIVSGILIGDFMVAFFHWLEDTYLPWTDAPGWVGDIARDNEMHHFIPFGIVSGSTWKTANVTGPLSLILGAVVYILAPQWTRSHLPLVFTMMIVGAISNAVHKYIHERPCTRPRIITWLQDAGILISSQQHAEHHTIADKKYGVILNFTNSVYDTLHVWRILEAILPIEPARKRPISEYTALYDTNLTENMKKPCPQIISQKNLDNYMSTLHREYNTRNTIPASPESAGIK
jgi:hypothetical protein